MEESTKVVSEQALSGGDSCNQRTICACVCTETGDPDLVNSFLMFRKCFFVDNLGWKLSTFGNVERDEFDNADAVYCVVFSAGEVIGGFRAIPTDRPYLGQSIFPALALSNPYPDRSDIWEVSRFGLIKPVVPHRFPPGLLYALMFRFALSRHARALVAIADLLHERLLKRAGIRTRRYGPPQTIGYDRAGHPIRAVAGEIPIPEQDERVLAAFLTAASNVEFIDETRAVGPARVSA